MASAAEQLTGNFSLANFGKAEELKKRIWFTLAALVIYRLGTYIPLPGIDPAALCFDPGIGFGKTLDHNLSLLRALGEIAVAGRPLLLGVSRKSFIGKILGSAALDAREWPTVAITANARERGVMLHRVHSVKSNVEALRMTEAILGHGS